MAQNFNYNKALDGFNIPRTIINAVQKASAATGVNFSYLMEKAAVESGFNPDAKARTSSATGLFQ
jgi:soluble lytic murein transglycosylase-like protein